MAASDLQSIILTVTNTWSLKNSSASGPFAASIEADSIKFNYAGQNYADMNQFYPAQFTIAASGHQDIDLTNLENPLNNAMSFARVYAIVVVPTGAAITLEPGPSNGLTWFFGGTSPTITIPAGGVFAFGNAVNTATTVNSTNKIIRLANGSGTSCTVEVGILGGV